MRFIIYRDCATLISECGLTGGMRIKTGRANRSKSKGKYIPVEAVEVLWVVRG
jgi:hypothetical protein